MLLFSEINTKNNTVWVERTVYYFKSGGPYSE